jgi:hypothetical protein
MPDIGDSFDVSATLPQITSNQSSSIASKTLETTPMDARIALRWNAMRKGNKRLRRVDCV